MPRYICIHGHFYQPPRENPWLEAIEQQDSAAPFHDWNERIATECYDTNRAARILDDKQRIDRIVNNYERISFNVGPTLMAWLERHRPETYAAILDADRNSCRRFAGHGAAIAQAYGHLILPLANRRDKQTQIVWGVRDFSQRFGRAPEGMWLPETAVDLETLELLATAGIAFTILAPHQALRVRAPGEKAWREVGDSSVDPRLPYRCRLPSGKSIALFFYDGPIARDIAFSGLLDDGSALVRRLNDTFGSHHPHELVHVATDGETYGHHHRFGEMALAWALDRIAAEGTAQLTNYAAFLAAHPPTWEVEIRPESAWSCAHGIERWRSDCGCRIGGQAGWTQAWRAPLRAALDTLRDRLGDIFEECGAPLFRDPWQARDDYIAVVLNRDDATIDAYLLRHCGRTLTPGERTTALRLLEMQRHAMQMFTSCGWFFDEVSGLETRQILTYACRAIQLAEECGYHLEGEFLSLLEEVPSNLRRWRSAAQLYEEQIRPNRLDLRRIAVHHAIAHEFGEEEASGASYCYRTEVRDHRRRQSGKMFLALAHVAVRSGLTGEDGTFRSAVLYFGAQHLTAGIRPDDADESFANGLREIEEAFDGGDIPRTVRLIDRHFAGHTYNLWHLFRNEQRRIVGRLLAPAVDEVLASFRAIYTEHAPLLRFLHELDMPLPPPLAAPAQQVVNEELRRLLGGEAGSLVRVQQLLAEAEALDLQLDHTTLGYAAAQRAIALLDQIAAAPNDPPRLQQAVSDLRLLHDLPWSFSLWQAQNRYLDLRRRPELAGLETFRELGTLLDFAPHSPAEG